MEVQNSVDSSHLPPSPSSLSFLVFVFTASFMYMHCSLLNLLTRATGRPCRQTAQCYVTRKRFAFYFFTLTIRLRELLLEFFLFIWHLCVCALSILLFCFWLSSISFDALLVKICTKQNSYKNNSLQSKLDLCLHGAVYLKNILNDFGEKTTHFFKWQKIVLLPCRNENNFQCCQSNRCIRWKTFFFSSAWACDTNMGSVLCILTAGLCCGVPAVSDLPGLRGSRRPRSQPSVSGRLPELPVLLPSGGGGGEQEDRLLLRHLVGRGRRTHHLVSRTAGCRAAALAALFSLFCFFFSFIAYLEFGLWSCRAPVFSSHCVSPLKSPEPPAALLLLPPTRQ